VVMKNVSDMRIRDLLLVALRREEEEGILSDSQPLYVIL